jgi:hypothetical protein
MEETMDKSKVMTVEHDTRYLKTYYISSGSKELVEAQKEHLLNQWPRLGYGTSATLASYCDTDGTWQAKVTRAHHCD